MRILVWSGDPGVAPDGTTGAAEHLREWTAALRRAGHDATLSAARSRWPAGLRGFGARLDAHLRFARAPAVELVWERFHVASAAPMRRARAPRWVELNAPGDLERRWPREEGRAGRLRARTLLRSAERVFAVSQWLAAWAIDAVGVAPDRVRWLPNGVPPGPPGDRDATRARLGLSRPTLLFVGSMHRWQGAEALPGLLDALPGWEALVVGDGPCPPAPHPRLRRVGRVPAAAVPDLVAAGDVGVAPYDPLGPPWYCPLKVLRCRAEGLPVVATAVGDCAALGAITLPDRDPSAWADACGQALAAGRVPARRTWDLVAAEALGDGGDGARRYPPGPDRTRDPPLRERSP